MLNNKTIRKDQKFSVSMAIVATVAILAIGSTTAYADTGFNNGYAKEPNIKRPFETPDIAKICNHFTRETGI